MRRNSATLLVGAGGDLIQLKKHGGQRSSKVAEGYIDELIYNKIKTFKNISCQSTSSVLENLNFTSNNTLTNTANCFQRLTSGTYINNGHNCTFNFNIVSNLNNSGQFLMTTISN